MFIPKEFEKWKEAVPKDSEFVDEKIVKDSNYVFKCKCLSSEFGNFPIYQETFTCSSCLNNDTICSYCYYHCHHKCHKLEKPYRYGSTFVCACARKLKHIPKESKQTLDEKEITDKEEIVRAVLETPSKMNTYLNFSSILLNIKSSSFNRFEFSNVDGSIGVGYPNLGYANLSYENALTLDKMISFMEWGLKIEDKDINADILDALGTIPIIISYYHLKPDFKTLKCLTPDNFLKLPLSEILYYKKTIFTKNSFSNVPEKYISNNKIFTIIRLYSTIMKRIVHYKKKEFDYQHYYIDFIYFCCQYMLFNIECIKQVIDCMKTFAFSLGKNILEVMDQSHYVIFIDTCFMLSQIYNVLVYEEHMNEKEEKHNHIFYNNEEGNSLILMLMYYYETGIRCSKQGKHFHFDKNDYLTKFTHAFSSPFGGIYIQFNQELFENSLSLWKAETSKEKFKESVDLVDKIYTLLNDFLTQKMDVDAVIDKFIEYLTQYKKYLQNKIQKTSTIQLNDLNHAKTLNRVQKFFEIPNAYISNIDEIVDELIYSNLDTALTKFLAVVYQVQVDTNIEAFANKDKQFLLLPINILSLLLLTKKGKQAISLGDPVFYLKTMSSNSYKLTAYVLDDFKIISSYIRLLPKEVVEEKITDNNQIYSKIGQNSKELDFILLKNMQELSTSDSYAWTLFKDKFIFLSDFCQKECSSQKFFDLLLSDCLTEEEKLLKKYIFRIFDALTSCYNNHQETFFDYCRILFEYFADQRLSTVFSSDKLTINKKRLCIQIMTAFWYSPLYNDQYIIKQPLTNEEYAAFKRYYCNDEQPKEKEKLLSRLQKNRVATVNDRLNEKSKLKIERKIKHLNMIKQLMIILYFEIQKIPPNFIKNTIHYFECKKYYKSILRSIIIITTFFYNYDKISNLILFPYFQLIKAFLEKEYIFMNFFELKDDERKDNDISMIVNGNEFDCLNKEKLIQVVIKEIKKFYPVVKNHKFNSVYSLYMKGIYNNRFKEYAEQFEFITNTQMANNSIIFKDPSTIEDEKLRKYCQFTMNEINDKDNYVLIQTMGKNPKAHKNFRELFTNNFCFDFLPKYILEFPQILNLLYKVSSYNIEWVIQDMDKRDEEEKKQFFSQIRNWLFTMLQNEYVISKYISNLSFEIQMSYLTVSLIKLLELFGEGYNFNFHRYIVKEREKPKKFEFDVIPKIVEDYHQKQLKKDEEERKKMLMLKKKSVDADFGQEYDYYKVEEVPDPEKNFPDEEKSDLLKKQALTIFEIVVILLDKNIHDMEKFEKYEFINPFDNNNLIVVTSLIDFLIEFFYTLNKTTENLIDNAMMWFLKRNFHYSDLGLSIFTLLMNNHDVINEDVLFLKSKLLDLVNSYISSGNKTDLIEALQSSQIAVFSPLSYFNQIMIYFESLKEEYSNASEDLRQKVVELNNSTTVSGYSSKLLFLYIYEKKFRDSWQITLILKIFKFLSILENKYNFSDISKFLEDIEEIKNTNNHFWKYDSMSTLGLYDFLKHICIPIELNYVVSEEEKKDLILKPEINEEKVQEEILSKEENKITSYRRVQKTHIREPQTYEDVIKEKYNTTFFNAPYYSFYLSMQSKLRFENIVDRSSKTSKNKSLISYIDTFLFEMIVNRYMFKNSKVAMFISQFNYFHFELLNFVIICIHNIILLLHYYKSWTLNQVAYDIYDPSEFNAVTENDNLVLAIVQMVFLIVVIAIWFRFNFILCFFNNLQFEYESKIPLFKRVRMFRELYLSKDPNFYHSITEHFPEVPFNKKLRVAIIDSFLLNNEITILIFTLLFLILYCIFHSPIFLVIPIIFLAHIFSTLAAIFKGIYLRFNHLFGVYIFTYIIIYIFMWFGFMFFGNLFAFDTVNSKNEPVATEPFCTSSIQCLLFFINFGIRSGGGIGDLLGMQSFKDNYIFFLEIFSYEIFFHLCIVMIFANVFLGLIADAFGELREQAWTKENDMKNICFICQIDTDTCVIKGIDFAQHIKTKHRLWHYVYFLCYLYMKDEKEYNIMEYKVMSSINELNLSWIPFAGNNDD